MTEKTAKTIPKLLPDSNIITGALLSRWGQHKAIIALCAAKTYRMVLSEWVQREVERNLLKNISILSEDESARLLDEYEMLIRLTRPIKVPLAAAERITAGRNLIRHQADVPVVLAAIDSQPDWIITMNRKHFTDKVAKRIGIRIASPQEFFEQLRDAFGNT